MKKTLHVVIRLFVFCLIYICAAHIEAQTMGTSISMDGSTPNGNAMLDVQSPNSGDGKGMLIPRVTLSQRTSASNSLAGGLLNDSGALRSGPAQGLLVYQTDGEQGLYYNTSTSSVPTWIMPGSGAAGDFMADGSVAMTGNLNMGGQNIINVASNIAFTGDEIIIGKGATADYSFDGVAIGSAAHGDYQGAAVGYQANATFGGCSVGYQARSYYYGSAFGYQAFATNYGVAVGREANAVSNGVAVGANAKGYIGGAALGANANAWWSGVAVGWYANGGEHGISIGRGANSLLTNIAIGVNANAFQDWGNKRIAIGADTTNYVNNSAVIRGTLYLDGGTGVLYRSTFGSGSWSVLGGGGSSGLSAFGYVYATDVGGQVVAGGADVVFGNNGPLVGCTHTAGTTTFTVPTTGIYKINYSVTITAGIGAQIAIAVNGMVDSSTPVDLVVATGNISGTAMLSLAAGDVITLRNNSATPFTTSGSPGVGAQLNVILMQ